MIQQDFAGEISDILLCLNEKCNSPRVVETMKDHEQHSQSLTTFKDLRQKITNREVVSKPSVLRKIDEKYTELMNQVDSEFNKVL